MKRISGLGYNRVLNHLRCSSIARIATNHTTIWFHSTNCSASTNIEQSEGYGASLYICCLINLDSNDTGRHHSQHFLVSKLLIHKSSQTFLYFVWGMLNDLSLLMNLAMVSVYIPGIAKALQAIILQFAYLDILQSSLWVP